MSIADFQRLKDLEKRVNELEEKVARLQPRRPGRPRKEETNARH